VATIRNRLLMLEQKKNSKSKEKEPATWTDPRNGLVWQKQDNPVRRPFAEAVAYCSNLFWEGKGDWKLASPEEWFSASENRIFHNRIIQPNQSYWTSKTQEFNHALYFFSSTKTVRGGKTGLRQQVLCVRGNSFDQAQMERVYHALKSNKSILAHRNFIKKYKSQPQAEHQVATVRNRLLMLEQKKNSKSTAGASGATKRQAYLDFLEAKSSNSLEALKVFLRKHAKTPGAERYLKQARLELQKYD
jgi:hypothetical protein